MAATNDRRALVNLSVAAGSVAMFAAAWTGIAQADGDRFAQADVPVTTAMAVAPVQPVSAPVLAAAPAVSDGQASPSTAPRRVVIVRQSRAS
jgi:hypothetical protein